MKGWPVAVILCSTNLKVWICSESYISYVLGLGTCRSKWGESLGRTNWEHQGSTRNHSPLVSQDSCGSGTGIAIDLFPPPPSNPKTTLPTCFPGHLEWVTSYDPKGILDVYRHSAITNQKAVVPLPSQETDRTTILHRTLFVVPLFARRGEHPGEECARLGFRNALLPGE